MQLACRQDYAAFFERELTYRKGLRYPPMVALVNAVVRGRSLEDATHVADLLAERIVKADASRSFTVLGPAPAPPLPASRETAPAVLRVQPRRHAPALESEWQRCQSSTPRRVDVAR